MTSRRVVKWLCSKEQNMKKKKKIFDAQRFKRNLKRETHRIFNRKKIKIAQKELLMNKEMDVAIAMKQIAAFGKKNIQ